MSTPETCRAAYRNVINWIVRILLDSYKIRFTMHGPKYIKEKSSISSSPLLSRRQTALNVPCATCVIGRRATKAAGIFHILELILCVTFCTADCCLEIPMTSVPDTLHSVFQTQSACQLYREKSGFFLRQQHKVICTPRTITERTTKTTTCTTL